MRSSTCKRQLGNTQAVVKCPEVIVKYNANKAHCDTFDKMCLAQSYLVEENMSCWKWWHKAFWGSLDGVYTNAYIIYRYWNKDISHHQYLVELQAMLVDNDYDTHYVTRGVSMVGSTPSGIQGQHISVKDTGHSSHHCVVCLEKWHEEKRSHRENTPKKWHAKRTIYKCLACNKHMCVGECFTTYHETSIDTKVKTLAMEEQWRYDGDSLHRLCRSLVALIVFFKFFVDHWRL